MNITITQEKRRCFYYTQAKIAAMHKCRMKAKTYLKDVALDFSDTKEKNNAEIIKGIISTIAGLDARITKLQQYVANNNISKKPTADIDAMIKEAERMFEAISGMEIAEETIINLVTHCENVDTTIKALWKKYQRLSR